MSILKALAIAAVAGIAGFYNALNDGNVSLVEVLVILGLMLGSSGVVWYATNGKEAKYVKAVVGALAATLTALITALDDGLISSQEWTAVALAFVGGLGLVWLAPGPQTEPPK